MATIIASVANTLREEILPTIYESLWELDPLYPMIARSSAGVVRNRGIGRGYQVLKTWESGISGGAKFVQALGGNVISGPQHFTMYDTPQAFPGVDEVTAPAYFQTSLSLIEHRGNFYLPWQLLQSDRLNASVGSVVSSHLKGVGNLLAMQEAGPFYSTSTTTYALGDIGDTSATVTNAAGDTAAVNINLGGTNASGRIHRFLPGLMIDIYDSTGVTKRNNSFYLVVDNVDPLAKTIRVRRVDGGVFQTSTTLNGGVTYAGAGGDDDIIVLKDSIGVAPNSLESFIADGSAVTSFFGVNVTNFGQFKSYVPSSIGAALTESLLNRHVGFYYESFPGRKLDCAITTNGVLIGFIDNLDGYNSGNANAGRLRYDRNGRPMEIDAGWTTFSYRYASRPLEIYTSTLCSPGTFYAGKLKNGGLVRYVPPTIPGAKSDNRFGAEVQFIVGLTGGGMIEGLPFKHAHNAAGQTTDMLEAPFVRHWNIMPTQPNFMKLTGITEVLG